MARHCAGDATVSRPGGPCRAVWLRVGRLVLRVPRALLAATVRATHPGDVPRAYLPSSFHGTVQSATTWRKAARVSGGAYVSPSRLPPRRFNSQDCPWFRSSLKLYRVPITELADIGFGSPGRMKRVARLMWPLRWRTTCATSPADCSRANRCSDTQAYTLPSAL